MWTWLKAMEVPPEMRVTPPQMSFFQAPLAKKKREGGGKANRGRATGVEERPLLEEVFSDPQYQNSAVMREFGVVLTADLSPARIRDFMSAAERELKRAFLAKNQPSITRWQGVITELEQLAPRPLEN